MIALDTNVLVRLITLDDAGQAAAARAFIEGKELFVSKTVLLETEWVLRFSYGLSRGAIGGAFVKLLGLRGLSVEDRPAATQALAWYHAGMDFADALHLASSAAAARFATFDRRLARTAEEAGSLPEIALLDR